MPPDRSSTHHPAGGDVALTLRDLGEREFLHQIAEAMSGGTTEDAGLIVGMGDDAAVFRVAGGPLQIVTTDTMAQDTHFRATTPAEAVGYRLAASNVSDIAAMGGMPTVAVLSLAVPATTTVEWLRGVYRGLRRAADEFGFRLVGGDTIRSEQPVLSLTLLGRLEPGVAPARRSNGRPGDRLYVTGRPGESGAGLQLLELPALAARMEPAAAEFLRQRHLAPTPRLRAGRAVARSLERVALVDVSDGVFNEVGLIAEASGGLGAAIEVARLPVGRELAAFAAVAETRALDVVLFGGEDYELLIACAEPPEEIAAILRAEEAGVEATPIGWLRAEPGVVLLGPDGRVLDDLPRGFSHFA